MGDLDIGMAMVAARIASSKTGKDYTARTRKDARVPDRDAPGKEWKEMGRKSTLPGVKMEVIKGELFLVPSGESTGIPRARGWTLTREDGSVVLLETGKIVKAGKGRE